METDRAAAGQMDAKAGFYCCAPPSNIMEVKKTPTIGVKIEL